MVPEHVRNESVVVAITAVALGSFWFLSMSGMSLYWQLHNRFQSSYKMGVVSGEATVKSRSGHMTWAASVVVPLYFTCCFNTAGVG